MLKAWLFFVFKTIEFTNPKKSIFVYKEREDIL